ncbi:nitroreductase family protein [Flavicella sediminum]|uniref:nitroreductase family protein n=1 Tax=Flavicella sediminum TaxID=2585141 RepID=UPI0011202327|nr:nitroreductase family protein [Flavicella sediminum]
MEKTNNKPAHIPYISKEISEETLVEKTASFYNFSNTRRSIREFSTTPIAKEVIENLIKTASTAPSGAHKQPWIFCAISNKALKSKIRIAAEKEEKENYDSRMSERWKKDLEPLATNHEKSFLEEAPWLIVVFKKTYELHANGEKSNNYYVNESVGIACGTLLAAIHAAGLVSLTHTPSPMNFLSKLLKRPANEKPFLLIPIGFAKQPTQIPNLTRKPLAEVSVFYEA